MALEGDYQVKIIEFGKARAELIANQLNSALVLHGDATDEELLENENIGEMDLFLSLTNDDENNIMSALLAKRLGARRVVALINRRSYADLMQGGQIDIAISPAQATIGKLLQHIRRGDVVAVHALRRGAAEALELVAHGDEKTCKVIGKKVEEIQLPRGATIGAIVRRSAPRSTGLRPRGAGARRSDHGAPRHDDLHRRSRDHVRRQQAHDPEGREAVPGRLRLRVAAGEMLSAARPPIAVLARYAPLAQTLGLMLMIFGAVDPRSRSRSPTSSPTAPSSHTTRRSRSRSAAV